MNWFYVNNGQQTGPVTDAQLDALISSGQISEETLVWKDGMAEWKPLQSVRAAGPLPPTKKACAECGRAFSPEDLIQLNNTWICGDCKPMVLQRLKEGVAPVSVAMWRDGKQLVIRQDSAIFPDRCVKCNTPANGFKMKRTLYWHNPALYLLILLNLLIFAIVVLIVRKKAVVHIGLCEAHRSKRRMAILFSWLGLVGGLLIACLGLPLLHSGWAVLFGVLLFLGTLVYCAVAVPPISAGKITKESVRIKGVGPAFLAGLPDWIGPA